jgi:hypothetical protein
MQGVFSVEALGAAGAKQKRKADTAFLCCFNYLKLITEPVQG